MEPDVTAAVQRLAVGVSVVTTLDGEAPHGATGMAWAEGRQPLLLTTLRVESTTRRLVADSGVFGVSVLDTTQARLTWQFAQRGERFAGVALRTGPVHGVPLLADAVAGFECTTEEIHPFGTHDIVIGRIVSCVAGGSDDTGPIVHYRRRLWSLEPA